MELKHAIIKKSGFVTTIKLNRPKEFNALNYELILDLSKAIEYCADDDETRVVVITGEGKAFCAGGDVSLMREGDVGNTLRQLIKAMNPVIIDIRRIAKPVIAMINGVAGGGGLTLAAACDIRIAASSAKFKQAYTSSGLVPDAGWSLLVPMLIGFSKASELVYIDKPFNSREAQEFGFVNMVVEDDKLEEITINIARTISEGPSIAYALTKENMNYAFFSLLERQLELEKKAMTKVGRTEDLKEGMIAFAQKRKPVFIGR